MCAFRGMGLQGKGDSSAALKWKRIFPLPLHQQYRSIPCNGGSGSLLGTPTVTWRRMWKWLRMKCSVGLPKNSNAWQRRSRCYEYGLKPFGLVVAIGCCLWALIFDGVLFRRGGKFIDLTAFSNLSESATACLVVSIAMILVWLFFFTKNTVRTAAFTYAEALLRSCDMT